MYESLKSLRRDPKEARAFADLFPKAERPVANRITDLLLKVEFRRSQLEAERIQHLARLIEHLKNKHAEKTKQEDDAVVLQIGTSSIDGDDPSLGPYTASYVGVALALPELVVLSPATSGHCGGGIILTFAKASEGNRRLPKGTYCFWVDLHPVSEAKKPKIACYAGSTSEVIPKDSVEKEIVIGDPSQLLSGMDMSWELTADADRTIFQIKNNSYDYLACLGVSMIAIF